MSCSYDSNNLYNVGLVYNCTGRSRRVFARLRKEIFIRPEPKPLSRFPVRVQVPVQPVAVPFRLGV